MLMVCRIAREETTMRLNRTMRAATLAVLMLGLGVPYAGADETCNSPYMSNLIKGQEDYLYVWTLGVKGMGDGSDKLVTLDVNPKSPKFGQVIDQVSVGGRGEAHHAGFTDDRRFLWAGGLDDSKIYVFDIHSNPSKPKLVNTIADFDKRSGLVGPHTFYALPGRMLIGAVSNAKDGGGVTGMALYNNKGDFIRKYDMPVASNASTAPALKAADGYGYDLAINPAKNVILSSSFTGKKNYMMPLGTLMKDGAAMKQFGNTMVVWNLKAMRPEQVLSVPGAPLEIRWSLAPNEDWAIGDPAKTPLPVDISMRADGKGLWVNTFMDGTTRYFDISNPEAPRQTYAKKTGSQVNMISQSWDGKRVYVSSSLLANWDKTGADNEQFVKLYAWDGKALDEKMNVDLYKLKLGRPHHMKFGAKGAQAMAQAGAATQVAAR